MELPYGIRDLVAPAATKPGAERVRCYVRDCRYMLRVPTRDRSGDVCPEHGIRCHLSTSGATYVYAQAERNIIAAADLFRRQLIGHPAKYESHRLGAERSEDALTWNVFRALFAARQLHRLVHLATGIQHQEEPSLYLWGLEISPDEVRPWPLLHAARRRFESHLPVERPLTEPDIALHLPGRYLLLIEAKFTSPNAYSRPGHRHSPQSLTSAEFLELYQDPTLPLFDLPWAQAADRLYQQLWRNLLFAAWMAREDYPGTAFFHVNLVRDGAEMQSCAEFARLLQPAERDRFRRLSWETIYRALPESPELVRLKAYLETKTAGLKPAFPSLLRRECEREGES